MFDEETEFAVKGSARGACGTLFAPNMFKRVIIGCMIMICQQFTGKLSLE